MVQQCTDLRTRQRSQHTGSAPQSQACSFRNAYLTQSMKLSVPYENDNHCVGAGTRGSVRILVIAADGQENGAKLAF